MALSLHISTRHSKGAPNILFSSIPIPITQCNHFFGEPSSPRLGAAGAASLADPLGLLRSRMSPGRRGKGFRGRCGRLAAGVAVKVLGIKNTPMGISLTNAAASVAQLVAPPL